ncbi:MAG TPA: isoleucine--tRNA ligase [Spirochaetota bacterium]|nr:isoleucine--tRNA ligase [Spirochaetota bacterium]HOM38405.1 isoleucine--tRNA ligase [Spirochaetota bacterium]HPQ48944.1 isoleucine--tRNA ligase [Spirochaetota bacterium]
MENYKDTLNLPKTDFPMKADLPNREPIILEKWEKERLYYRIIESRKDNKPFILHDGPPYANGHIHLGHSLNKILKDIIVKYKTMAGNYSPYIPGWDCHGLPIEFQVMKNLGEKAKTTPLDKIRKECRNYAQKFIDIQMKEFKRLGVLGDYENPYKTMDNEYEADILIALAKLVEKGYVYKGLKPVYWCGHCITALADAEIEYYDHKSPSIYVKFPVINKDYGKKTYVIIWTTTPWTLPANVAISFNPETEYSLIEVSNELYIIATALLNRVSEEIGFSFKEVKRLKKSELESLSIKHPFIERDVKPVFGHHVTLDVGTGAVHTAPGHGTEDYEIGLEYNLPVISPVDDEARFTSEVEWHGMNVFEANTKIIEKLKNLNLLLHSSEIEHSYPHCWRCKKPVIFRATPQWFIRVDENFKKKLLKEIKNVKWIPSWGENRITAMIENRPDWCISRQRSWGVPIPAVYCKDCNTSNLSAENIYKVAEVVKKEGLDTWFTKDIDFFLGKDYKCPNCGSKNLSKESDILDVWFDSGVSWFAVIKKRGLGEPTMYLEGSDQHRGWFQSSLIPGVAIDEKAPYKQVLTHGFMLDENGRAMSKSLGNVIPPETIIKKYGADVLRLWVTTQDYTQDMRIGENLLAQTADAYRKIRNTFRFMLGNLYDFEPENAIKFDELEPIDKWAISKLSLIIEEVKESYENYNFNAVFKKMYNFFNLELSAFYFDILKDLLYTSKKDGHKRRSAQTAIYNILKTSTLLIAPILVFTAEEVWQYIKSVDGSVHENFMPEKLPIYKDELEEINKIIQIREDVLKAIEIERQNKKINTSLEASIKIEPKIDQFKKILKKYQDKLYIYFIASEVIISEKLDTYTYEGETSKVLIEKAKGEKCPRCWKYSTKIGENKEHKYICPDCIEAIK